MPCCSVTNGVNAYGAMLNGLGDIDMQALTIAINDAKRAWEGFLEALGIGAGRMEADVIVPLQNKITTETIVPVSAFLTDINTGKITPTCSEIRKWQLDVATAEGKWLGFLHNTEWKDGRAAQQAEATLAPYFANAKRDLTKYESQYCGILGGGGGGGISTPFGEISLPMLALAGGAIYLLTRRK